VTRTLDAVDAAGITHAGSARTPAEAEQTTIVDVETTEAKIGVALRSHTYGFNAIPYPDGETFWANEIDEQTILADAARRAGAVPRSWRCTGEVRSRPQSQQVEGPLNAIYIYFPTRPPRTRPWSNASSAGSSTTSSPTAASVGGCGWNPWLETQATAVGASRRRPG
jgi:hypothetical protein